MVKQYSLTRDGNTNLSQHFKIKEFACKDGSDKILVDDELVDVLQRLRVLLNKPIKITSGYRTESYNKKCGGADDSFHCLGKASDIQVDGISPTKVAIYSAMVGARGIGIYPNFTHIDVRPDKIVFRDK